jgi:hypothetical protein
VVLGQVKVRLELDGSGFEKWAKLKCIGGMGVLGETLAGLGHGLPPQSLPRILLAKRRAQRSGSACTFEETEVVVRTAAPSTAAAVGSAGDGAPLGSPEVWRSVAVEGKRKACAALQAELLPRVVAAASPGDKVMVCSYAEFVAVMAAQSEPGPVDPAMLSTTADALQRNGLGAAEEPSYANECLGGGVSRCFP